MFFFSFFCILLNFPIWAVTESRIELESVTWDMSDKGSIERGAENFKNNCMSCHSLRYARNNNVLAQAGITQEMMPQWPSDSWGGHPPPDLSLMARQMGEDWIYTYLHAYYQDSSRPTGFNNLVYPHTNMPNPFITSQGLQVLIADDLLAEDLSDKRWYQVIKLHAQGNMSPVIFDRYVLDIVHFLAFISDPSVDERHALAPWVLGYLLLLIVATSLVYHYHRKDATKSRTRSRRQ